MALRLLENLAVCGSAVLCLALPRASAQSAYGLAPSTNSLGRAEAVTASVSGTDALFYNPAALAWNSVSLRIAGVESTSGIDAKKIKFANSEKATLEDAFALLNETDSVYMTVTARALDVALPFAGMTSFARGEAAAREASEEGFYDLSVRTDVGAIGGLGLRYGKFSLGYAQYGIVRAEVNSHPSAEQVRQTFRRRSTLVYALDLTTATSLTPAWQLT